MKAPTGYYNLQQVSQLLGIPYHSVYWSRKEMKIALRGIANEKGTIYFYPAKRINAIVKKVEGYEYAGRSVRSRRTHNREYVSVMGFVWIKKL